MATLKQNELTFNVQDAVPLPLKTKDFTVVLGDCTWSESTSGKYLASVTVPGLTSNNKILSVNINYLFYIRASDEFMIQCRDNTVVICSHTNTFAQAESQLVLRILYI